MTKRLERLQIIWDSDHGAANEGWYVRMRERDGAEIDEPVDLAIRENARGCISRRAESTLRGEARRVARSNGYRVPSALPVEIR